MSKAAVALFYQPDHMLRNAKLSSVHSIIHFGHQAALRNPQTIITILRFVAADFFQ